MIALPFEAQGRRIISELVCFVNWFIGHERRAGFLDPARPSGFFEAVLHVFSWPRRPAEIDVTRPCAHRQKSTSLNRPRHTIV